VKQQNILHKTKAWANLYNTVSGLVTNMHPGDDSSNFFCDAFPDSFFSARLTNLRPAEKPEQI